MNAISIDGRRIGEGFPAYMIAEISANHRQSIELARELIHAAKEAGADAVKLQTYTPDTITIASGNGIFRIGGDSPWKGKTLHELYNEAYMPWDWQPELKALAEKLGLALFSSPFDLSAVDFLERMDVPAYKIASFELVDIPLIRKAASTGRPLIMSTGMASIPEIEEAVATAKGAGCKELSLLRCVSGYPAKIDDMSLADIRDMESRFDAVPGLSDHTLETFIPSLAIAAGAKIIEKHITLRRADGGPDSGFSLEPQEFKEMVKHVRLAERAMGKISYQTGESEKANRIFRRSLYAVADIAAGEAFTSENVKSIRPADGLHTRHYDKILGLKAKVPIPAGSPLSESMIKDFD